jgi:predicted SAM-dependent methyltransferase
VCTTGCILFGIRCVAEPEVRNKRVIEVGSRDVNGSLRPFIELYHPREYIGVDIQSGPGVDRICEVEHLVDTFGEESFDMVVSTEMLEHVREWRRAVSALKGVCKRGGKLVITTRSLGFPYHDFPHDFWRYEPGDVRAIFSDMEILILETDRVEPGVLMKLRKPDDFHENDLSDYQLFSMVSGRNTRDCDDRQLKKFMSRKRIRRKVERLINRTMNGIG